MKRFIAASLLSLSALMAGAHSHGGRCHEHNYCSDHAHSGMFSDLTVGLQTGCVDPDFGIAIKAGYRLNLYEGLSWNIISAGAEIGVTYADVNLRFMSGLRYNLPFCLNSKTVYVNADFGYGFSTSDTAFGGFAYEIGAGVNFSRTISLGVAWEGSVWDYHLQYGIYDLSMRGNFGIIGLKLGINY